MSSVVIRGSSIYSAPELFAIYREQLGKPITNASAGAIVTALAQHYERDGFSRPQIRIDDKLMAGGILRLDVLETRIGAIEINGNPGPHRERLQQLGAALENAALVHQGDLQEVLRRMRALPGLSLSAATARDELMPNVYRLELDTDFEPVSGAIRLSNRGTEEIGPNFLLGQAVANGLLGGQTNAGVLFGAATDYSEYHGLGFLTDTALGDRGMRASAMGFRSRSDPLEPGADRDDLYVRDRVSLRLTRPLRQSSSSDWRLSFALDLEDLAIFRSGDRLRDERLRMFETGLRISGRREPGVQYVQSVELVKGLGGLGSGLTALDLTSDPRREDFSLLRLSLIRLMRLGDAWSVRLDAFGQHTNDVLPYSERFKIGGDRLGRGFEVAEIAGDQGVGGKVELQRHLRGSLRVLERAHVYTFYDVAATWKSNVSGRESAASAGVGLSLRGGRITSMLELAKPLTHADVEGRKDLSLFLELTLQL